MLQSTLARRRTSLCHAFSNVLNRRDRGSRRRRVMGADRTGRSLRLSRFLDRGLVPCGSAGSGLSDSDAQKIRAALDAKQAVIARGE